MVMVKLLKCFLFIWDFYEYLFVRPLSNISIINTKGSIVFVEFVVNISSKKSTKQSVSDVDNLKKKLQV